MLATPYRTVAQHEQKNGSDVIGNAHHYHLLVESETINTVDIAGVTVIVYQLVIRIG